VGGACEARRMGRNEREAGREGDKHTCSRQRHVQALKKGLGRVLTCNNPKTTNTFKPECKTHAKDLPKLSSSCCMLVVKGSLTHTHENKRRPRPPNFLHGTPYKSQYSAAFSCAFLAATATTQHTTQWRQSRGSLPLDDR